MPLARLWSCGNSKEIRLARRPVFACARDGGRKGWFIAVDPQEGC